MSWMWMFWMEGRRLSELGVGLLWKEKKVNGYEESIASTVYAFDAPGLR